MPDGNHQNESVAERAAESQEPAATKRGFGMRVLGRGGWAVSWLYFGVGQLFRLLLVAWASLVIFYSNLPWPSVRIVLAVVFAVLCIWAIWISRRPRMRWAFGAAFMGVVFWFISISPSHDRPWRPEFAVMPRAIINGDRVRITGVRNFTYRSRHDFDERWEEREFSISRVQSLDLYISYWTPGPVAHTFVSFNFDDGTPPLCISIEVRPEIGEGFDPLASLFKQFELVYIVGDEHDLVGSRASHRNEDVFLYRILARPERVRILLQVYLKRINELADEPEWYHLLSNSCTVNIFRYANASGREGRFDLRHLLNGWVDYYLFAAGRMDTSRPFAELRRRSRITDLAKEAAYAPDFSERIRAKIPIPAQPNNW